MEAEYHKLKTFPSFRYKIESGAISRQGSESDGEIPKVKAMHAEGSEAESDIPRLRTVSSFKHVMEAATEWSGSEGELPRYTSLKDVMSNLSPGGGDADVPNIRNELVKHAASAYVLSATVINPAQRGQDSRIYDRIKSWFLTCHVGLPLCWPLVDFVYQIVRRIRNGLRGVVEVT
ncbi:hypothetical protein SASPL_117313 [Salvia splendens]|uniref:Uncharacterized protein n=1 Tax=Salvia splendens TaxID=180675 RepID=A0A8X8XXQ0_SALSN|nr:hypothetical protein SASPL_117313 [Salvia splendens]